MNDENIYKTIRQKAFLIEALPEPLTPADKHLQIFDNYIEGTRIRLRKVRMPETKRWTWSLEQIFPCSEGNFERVKISRFVLNEAEYETFKIFEGREIRKNRYFYDLDGIGFEIDIYLGRLWGLNIAKVYFETKAEQMNFKLPEFAVLEITNDEFFAGESLVEKEFRDIQNRLAEK